MYSARSEKAKKAHQSHRLVPVVEVREPVLDKNVFILRTLALISLFALPFTLNGYVMYTNEEVSIEAEEEKILSVEEIIESYDWDPDVAYAVMMAESHGNPEAYNPEWHKGCQGSFGLFQIACVHGDNPEDLYQKEYNIKRAYEIWSEQGWEPWGAYTNGGYRKHL